MEKKSFKFFWVIGILIFMSGFSVPRKAVAMSLPTIDDCVNKMGFTKEKCTEMIAKFNMLNDSEKQGVLEKLQQAGIFVPSPSSGAKNDSSNKLNVGQSSPNTDGNLPLDSADNTSSDPQVNLAMEMKSKKLELFGIISDNVESIIGILRKYDINTERMENDMAIFKAKEKNVFEDFDSYIGLLKRGRDNYDYADLQEARLRIKNEINDALSFYRLNLREDMVVKIDELANANR